MGTTVKYTASYTMQQNGKVECAFPTLFERACAACNGAKLLVELWKKIFCEAFRDAVQKDGILLTQGRKTGPPTLLFLEKMLPT